MFKFIKKLFAKEEEKVPEKEDIALDALGDWFDSKSKMVFDELNENIKIIKEKISSEIEKTKSNLEVLKNAKLKNPNIPPRAKNMMEGNRESYLKAVSNFVDRIVIVNDAGEILNFCNGFNKVVESLGKSTTRSYHLLKEFFAHEVTDIAINIRNIENSVKELKSTIENSNIDKTEDIKKDILSIKNKITQKKDFEGELKNKEAELIKLKKEKETLVGDIESVKNSEGYLDFNKLKEEKEELKRQIKEIENNIFHSFSILERALKKYSRIVLENQKLLESYLENPVNSLLRDKDMMIIKILDGLEKNIVQGNIELDEKKKNKTLAEIKRADKQFFIDILKEYYGLNEKLKTTRDKIQNSEVKKSHDGLNEKLNQVEGSLEKIDSSNENLKKEIERINIEQIKDNLQEEINKTIKTDISIS